MDGSNCVNFLKLDTYTICMIHDARVKRCPKDCKHYKRKHYNREKKFSQKLRSTNMSELFEQVFQSFWTFLGTACLLSIAGDVVVKVFAVIVNGILLIRGYKHKETSKKD